MMPASPKIKTVARVSPYRVGHSLRDWACGSDSTQACRGSHRAGSRSFGLGTCCALGNESVGLYRLRATSEVTDRS